MYTNEQQIALPEGQDLNESNLAILMNDASIDQVMALDLDLKVIAWNRTCEEVMRIPKSVAIGRSFYEVRPGANRFAGIQEALYMALKGFKSFLPWEKGAYAGYSEHHFIPLKSADEVIGVLVLVHDVAHRIKAEQELQRLNKDLALKAKALQDKNDELAHFNWIVSHDLKEPLRKIYTFVEMVATKEGEKLTEAGRTNLRRAQSAAQRMGLLTDDIATFTQVAAPSEELVSTCLKELLINALGTHKRLIENDNAVVEYDEMPVIKGYPRMLSLLFEHMLGNALKFHSEDTKPKVRISYDYVPGTAVEHPESQSDAHYHYLSFEDNGIGIESEYLEKVFAMFQRLHPRGTYKGTGMGLAICRKVAETHNGFITVTSKCGVGSTFNCYLKDLS